jgi:mannose-6-phosphate isomerase-like protein (cupin superfamily)
MSPDRGPRAPHNPCSEAAMEAKTDVHRKSSYVVKHVETVVAGTDARVRLFTLAQGDVIPWHCHSQCADHYFVLEGELTVETRNPDKLREIKRGERHNIEPRAAHQISNRSQGDCRFLLVQGVGTFDWINAEGQ